MTMQSSSDFESEKPVVNNSVGVARRRLLRAGLAATPVILAVSGRSAMAAGNCNVGLSPTAWNSVSPNNACVNNSHSAKVNGKTRGNSPLWWKPSSGNLNATKIWPALCVPFTASGSNPAYASGTTYTYTDSNAIWDSGTKFNQIFTASSETRSFSRILIDSADSYVKLLCATYLNSQMVPGYPLTDTEVKNLVLLKLGTKDTTEADIRLFLAQTWNP